MAKDRSHPSRPVTVGLIRKGDTETECGLCGKLTRMSKTHVPPQCAGNDGFVSRVRLVTDSESQTTRRDRPRRGGMYVYGLCERCNGLASKYDGAYATLAWALQPLWPRDERVVVPDQVALPSVAIQPGAVARSMLIGMFGVNPRLRKLFGQLADDLLAERRTELPADLTLRLALCRSNRARICGGMTGVILFGPYSQPRINNTAPGVVLHAAVYFPPLGWVLTVDRESILDRFGYGDASEWITHDPAAAVRLPSLAPTLVYADYPQHDPRLGEWWTELLSDEISEIVETDYLPPSVLRQSDTV